MNLGICILNYNSGEQLLECVRKILATVGSIQHRILVVDNQSADDSIARLRAAFPNVAILENRANLGYARGNNAGAFVLIKQGCDFLLILNPDATVTGSTISCLLQSLRDNPTAGCAGGPSRSPDGTVSSGCRTKPQFWEKMLLYSLSLRALYMRLSAKEREVPHASMRSDEKVYAIKGACILLRSNAFQQVGGFDPATFLYEEEFILAEKLYHAGWKIIYSRDALYDHITAHSTRRIPLRQILHFMDSEQHLMRSYYQWSALARTSILLFRWAEWALYAIYWTLLGRLRHRKPEDRMA